MIINEAFYEALNVLHVKDLKAICLQLNLPFVGVKKDLLTRIITFLEEGTIVKPREIPSTSRKKVGQIYPLLPNTHMVYGVYKNDAATRAFFKKLIGSHFHYTAFGIDWLNERWLDGNPPTYEQFANYWQQEYLRRKQEGEPPKKEWALINFVQNYLQKNPQASKTEVLFAWKQNYLKSKMLVQEVLKLL